jgi:hypothetical protein
MEICACPQCGLPAEVVDESVPGPVSGGPIPAQRVPGPLDLVRVRCIDRHWFFGSRERLVA